MKHIYDGYNWIVRLDKGELLVASLQKFVSGQNIPSAWISGLGGAQRVEVGFYDLEAKNYKWHEFSELLEITNLSGNIACQDGKPAIHLHGTFSDQQMRVFGGHVRELTVGGTCEIFLHRWYRGQIARGLDSQTGLNLLDL